jgi:sugar lactone lactonase YvrE
VQERDSTGALVRTLDTGEGAGTFTTGLALDSAGTLYVTDFNANDVSHLNGDGTLFGSFGSGYNTDPESIVFDSSGNAYVGQADGSHSVLKFSSSGALLASFSPAIEDRGTDWIDLAPDQCTLYYTSEDLSVKRFDVCSNSQLSDFATGLPAIGYAVKVLPGGGALVADTDAILRLDASGNIVQQYGTGESGVWFSLALDPGGTAFWAGDSVTGDVKKFDLSSGSILASFNTGVSHSDSADGIVVAP